MFNRNLHHYNHQVNYTCSYYENFHHHHDCYTNFTTALANNLTSLLSYDIRNIIAPLPESTECDPQWPKQIDEQAIFVYEQLELVENYAKMCFSAITWYTYDYS